MSEEEIKNLQKHIVDAIGRRDDEDALELKNPCAPFLMNAIPNAFPVARSKVQYLLKVINAVGRFYPDEILRVEKDGVTYGLLTPKHTWLGLRIYLNSFVNECLHMPSHGTDLLKLFPDTRIDKFGLAGSDIVKMTSREIRTAAKSAGLPFTKLEPVLTGLLMTGFLEEKEEDGKKFFFKSPLLRTPESKINWNEMIDSTKEFVEEYWSEISREYIQRYCDEVKAMDPFTGEEIIIGADASSPSSIEVVGGEWPSFFKYKSDWQWVTNNEWDEIEFLLNVKGDYGKEEIKTINDWKHS
tara:strand:+ start:25 stop:918 length:894 start_codon:yes stop_codon:yes gene_type:complete